ncbi:MAG: hypothetical protein WC185_04510 [Acholeplasmataceae bacterium]
MKQRNFFVSNSSSCSFTCYLSGTLITGWDWDDPIDSKLYKCTTCGKSFLIKELQKHNIVTYPDRRGWIKSKDCPYCNGYRREIILLKPDETYKVMKKGEI